MSFCPKCGRRRGASARFCGGCGNDFGQPADGGVTAGAVEPGEPAAPDPVEQTRWDAPAGQTRWDGPASQTRQDGALGPTGPDPFALGFAETLTARGAAAAGDEPPNQWMSADTGHPGPAQAPTNTPPYTPPAQPAPGYPPPAAVPGRRPGGRTTALVVVAVLVVLAAGGGAYAFARSHRHPTASPPGSPVVTTRAGTGTPVVQGSTGPAASASASPVASPSVSVTPSPTQTGTVQIAPGAANDPAEPQVEAYLNRYFSAINTRNYSEYQSLLDAQEQQGDSRSTFDSGFATTTDSNEVLTGIDDTGGGSVTAHVSFTSHQSPANSVDGSACNNWQISLYLVPQGSSYVMTAVPAGYHAVYTDC
jgi:hypothetical protein